MRTQLKFLILIVLVSFPLYSQWTLQNYDTNYTLTNINFVNENTGIAVGASSYYPLQIYKGIIYKTTNGGSNWRLVFLDTNIILYATCFITDSEWLAVGGLYSPQPKMLKSTNGGNNWFYTSTGEISGVIHSIKFFDNIAYATCINGVFKSTNHGINWTHILPGFGEYSSSYFINELTGWSAFNNGSISKTTNGGLNWTVYTLKNYTFAHKIYFTNSSTGYAIYDSTAYFNPKVHKTTNGGASWQRLYSDILNMHWSIYFVNENTGFMCGTNIIKTTDAGNSWFLSYTGSKNSGLLDIKFLNHNTGFACGQNSIIIKTTTGGVIGIEPVSTEMPEEFTLEQNYPNPFNPATNIKFSIPKVSFIKLKVYDILGRVVESLVNQQLTAGTYVVEWNAAKFSSGVYFYKLTADDFSMVRKMSLIK